MQFPFSDKLLGEAWRYAANGEITVTTLAALISEYRDQRAAGTVTPEGWFTASRTHVADRMGVALNKIDKPLKILVKKGLIERRRKYNYGTKQLELQFRITDIVSVQS